MTQDKDPWIGRANGKKQVGKQAAKTKAVISCQRGEP